MAKGAITVKIDGQYDDKDINRAIKDLGALKSQASGGTGPMDKLTGAFGKLAVAAGGLFALKEVAGFLGDSVQAAIADEAELSKLNQTLENLGFGNQAAALATWIDNLQYSANVSESELRPALQSLIVVTKDVAKAQDLMQVALDLSASGFGTVQDASNALAKAISTGSVARLNAFTKGALGPAIVKSKDLDGALQKLSDTFGGAAATKAETLQSKLDGLKIATGELQEALGQGMIDGFVASLSGGTGDIDEAERSMRNMQETVGQLGEAIGNLAGWAISAFGVVRGTVVEMAYGTVQAMNTLYDGWINLADMLGIMDDAEAEHQRVTQESIKKAQEQAYYEDLLGYKFGESAGAAGAATTAVDGYAGATGGATAGTEGLTTAQQDAKIAADNLKVAVDRVTNSISRSQDVDDYNYSLANLDVTLKGLPRSFDGMGDGAKKNRDTIRTEFGMLKGIVQGWVDDGKISAGEFEGVYSSMGGKIVRKFVAAGFKRDDIVKWLGEQGIWTGPVNAKIEGAATAAKPQAYSLFKPVGWQAALGTASGLSKGTAMIKAAAIQSVLAARDAANAALEISSPSKVFFRIGEFTVQGLIDGMKSKNEKVKEEATALADGITAKATTIVDGWDREMERLKGVLDTRRAEMTSFAQSVSSSIAGALSFASIAPQVGEDGKLVGGSFLAGLEAQAGGIIDWGNKIQTLVSMGLSLPALQQVLAAGQVAGTAIANELIAGGTAAIDQTNWFVESAQAAADRVGVMAATNFYGAGVVSAQATYEGFKKNFGEGGPARIAMENLMDRLANSLNRTVTVSVRTVYEAAGISGARALGGPVTAGRAWLVGEKGPEVFVPSSDGNIIPNGGLPTASGSFGQPAKGGNTYQITVQAGVGDPRAIGQQVVEYIRRFENASGPVFAAA